MPGPPLPSALSRRHVTPTAMALQLTFGRRLLFTSRCNDPSASSTTRGCLQSQQYSRDGTNWSELRRAAKRNYQDGRVVKGTWNGMVPSKKHYLQLRSYGRWTPSVGASDTVRPPACTVRSTHRCQSMSSRSAYTSTTIRPQPHLPNIGVLLPCLIRY